LKENTYTGMSQISNNDIENFIFPLSMIVSITLLTVIIYMRHWAFVERCDKCLGYKIQFDIDGDITHLKGNRIEILDLGKLDVRAHAVMRNNHK